MITRCPACSTVFRVAPEQLQAHQGQVRCGRCLAVFDGLQALVVLPEQQPAPGTAHAGAGEVSGLGLEAVKSAAAIAAAPAGGAAPKEEWPAPPQQEPAPVDDLFREPPRNLPPSRWWGAGIALLLLALAGQAAYSYRSDLVARYPGLRPYLVRLCGLTDCRIFPPQRPKQIAIEASDLQAVDPARPGLIQLTATLRNYAGYDLAYPALDLVLTNTKEHALARRIFLPGEYLERGKDLSAGIPANAEITIRLDLDTGELNPAGFRLDLLPAPPP